MKKIAIFTSDHCELTQRLVEMLASDERTEVEIVVTDRENSPIVAEMEKLNVATLIAPREVWHERPQEIVETLSGRGVDTVVLDHFSPMLPEEISSKFKVMEVCCDDDLPRAAGELGGEQKSVDEEWAETLKLNYDPTQAQATPPPIPQAEGVAAAGGYATVPPVPQAVREPMPNTYLLWSILCAIFCCFIPGVVAIVFSALTSSRYCQGNYEGARKASRQAEIWIIVSFVLGVVTAVFYLPFMLIS